MASRVNRKNSERYDWRDKQEKWNLVSRVWKMNWNLVRREVVESFGVHCCISGERE